MKCSKRSKLTHTSPKTSCLRVSLRQGNLAGAKGPVRVALRVCVGHITVKGGFLGVHVGRDSEMVCDGQGETRRISLVCLRERSNTNIHTHTKGEICLQDGFHVHGMRGVGQAFVCKFVYILCVCLLATDPGTIYFSRLVRQLKATDTLHDLIIQSCLVLQVSC